MSELQKQKANSSKLRRFLNGLKGESYRSTNTIYRPFDFIYSLPLLVYVLILAGLWFTNGLTDSMEIKLIKDTLRSTSSEANDPMEFYLHKTISNLTCVLSGSLAIVLALFKCGRRWLIFLAYLVVEVCLLGSLIAEYGSAKEPNNQKTKVALTVMYHFCKFSSHFGFIFLMLITAELFPTSLRCTGFGICFTIRAFGSFISSPDLLNYNANFPYRITYCLLTLLFGSLALFLPETKSFPLPRSILQIEAMPTIIGKTLRSRKVQLACERRQNQYAGHAAESTNRIYLNTKEENINLLPLQQPQQQQQPLLNSNNQENILRSSKDQLLSNGNNNLNNNTNNNNNNGSKEGSHSGKESINDELLNDQNNRQYETVTSIHDIEQDDHHYYNKDQTKEGQSQLLSIANSLTNLNINLKNKLTKIVEVPSKQPTRNNSMNEIDQQSTATAKL